MYAKKEDNLDSLFEKLKSFYPNIKLTIEKNPTKFLYNEVIRRGCEAKRRLYNKPKKLSVNWSSKVLTRYKRNAIKGELYSYGF